MVQLIPVKLTKGILEGLEILNGLKVQKKLLNY